MFFLEPTATILQARATNLSVWELARLKIDCLADSHRAGKNLSKILRARNYRADMGTVKHQFARVVNSIL